MKNIPIYLATLIIAWSCKKEIGPQILFPGNEGKGDLLVLNEGNFGFGNASVSILNSETGEIANNQFRLVNGVGIGDVLQSAKRYQDKYYFVVNNSGKIVVTDTNLSLLHEIKGFNSPRYLEFYGNKAFVSDLKQGGIYVVNLDSRQIVNEIATQGWTEELEIVNSKLIVMDRGDYLSNSDSNHMYIIDPELEIKTDSLKTGINPNSYCLDGNGKLWVLTSGLAGLEVPALTQYDLDSKNILFQYQFSTSRIPNKLRYSSLNNRLYFIDHSIYSIHTNGTEQIPQIFYRRNTENFYGLDVIRGKIYATNAKNYNQSGDINIFDFSGNISVNTGSGLIPAMIVVK